MKAKRTFYINYDGTRTQIAAPINWENDKLTLQRHDDINTVVRITSLDDPIFIFDDTITPVGASTLLQSIYEADGADAYATLEVLRLDNDTNDYLALYEGYLNFRYYNKSGTNKSVSITLTDSSDLEKFNNRKDISVRTDETTSLDGDTVSALVAHDITLQKQELIRTEEFTMYQESNLDVNETETTSIVSANSSSLLPVYKIFSLLPPDSSGLPLYNTNGSSEAFIGYTTLFTTCLSGTTSDSFAKILVSDYLARFSVSAVEFNTLLTATLTIRQISGSTVIKSIEKTTSEYLTTSTRSFEFDIADIGFFYLEKGDYLEWNFRTSTSVLSDISFGETSQSIRYDEITSSESSRSEDYSEFLPQYTDDSILSEFVNEITLPQGDDETNVFENKKEYTRLINLITDEKSVTATLEGITIDGVTMYVASYVQKIDSSGNVIDNTLLYSIVVSSLGTFTTLTTAINNTYNIESGYKLNLVTTVTSSVLDESDILAFSISNIAIDFKIIERSPDDSIIEAFDAFEVLSHVSDVILGTGKLVINNDIVSIRNKPLLNSGYNLHIARGSHIRGFASTYGNTGDAPLIVDFITLYDSIAKLLGLGLEYKDDYFYLDYLTNINSNNIIDIGEVSDFNESSAEDIPKTLTVGDSTTSDVEEYYLTNEGHNKTTYAYPTVTAQDTLDYTTEISTSAITVEGIRRVNSVDTPDLSLNTDSLLYFIKCYDGYKSEKEERITIDPNNVPDNFGDLNLCFLPSYVINNNKEFLGRAFFRKVSTSVLKFMSSIYGLNLTTTNNSGTFVEQNDILSTVIGSQKSDPIEYSFKMPMTDDILAAVSADPNAKIMFSHNDETYIGRIKTDTELEIFLENGEWTLEKAN